jgi:hypothetical protein
MLRFRLGAKTYRPNSRSISQPSNPAAASGCTELRVGAARFGPPTGNGTAGAAARADGAEGAVICEATCARLPKGPDPCEFGSDTTGTP